jgi:hypothetical protein
MKTPKKEISEVPLTLERAAVLINQSQTAIYQLTLRIEMLERTLAHNGCYL